MRYERALLAALVVLRLALGLIYSAANPLGEAPDEADHYAYAAYIATQHALPSDPSITQAKHPPLYYLLAAAAAAPAGDANRSFLRSNPDAGFAPGAAPNFFIHTTLESWPWQGGALAMHLGRLVSVLAGAVLVVAAYGLGRRVWPALPAVALAGAAFVALLPEGLFIGGAMSNDTLAAALATLALWSALAGPPAADGRTWLPAASAGLLMGLAFVTKASTASLWPVVALALLLRDHQPSDYGHDVGPEHHSPSARAPIRPTSCPYKLVRAFLAVTVALLVAAPWLVRNWQLYGDPMGTRLMLATIDRRSSPLGLADLWWLARGWFFSFWGKFGAAGHLALPAPFYALWAALLLAAFAGWVRWILLWRRGRRGPASAVSPAGWAVLLGAPVITVLGIVSYSQVALGTDQGRLLFPALAPAALLLAAGLAAWVPERRLAQAAVGWSALLAGVAVLALVAGIVQPFASPAFAGQQASAAGGLHETFGGRLNLTASKWDAATGRLELYWQVEGPVRDDLRVALRLVDADGNVLWEWKRSPGEGRYSTDRWQPGQVVPDVYQVPHDKLSQAERLELGVYDFATGAWLQPVASSSSGPYRTLVAGDGLH